MGWIEHLFLRQIQDGQRDRRWKSRQAVDGKAVEAYTGVIPEIGF
jgi:hypothetical protein